MISDVEDALEDEFNSKVDKVAGKGLSTEDFTKDVNNLTYYTLTTQTGSKIDLEINSSTYQLTAKLYDKNNNLISTSNVIDLPIESMVVNASYSSGILTLTLQNGNTLDVDISDIVSGLVKPSDLVDYVKNTDYATSNKGGVVKNISTYGASVNSSGVIFALSRTYSEYQSSPVNYIISKGTLENVLTEKIGDIESILHTLNTGSGV